ncbi:MAG: heparin lyase I family protein [Bosea sp. (in: a-proteobacteria)]
MDARFGKKRSSLLVQVLIWCVIFDAFCLGSVASDTISDDFIDHQPASHWFVCNRAENSFSFGTVLGETRNAATIVVKPRTTPPSLDPPPVQPSHHHRGCRDSHRNDVIDGPNDRAELWEADPTWLSVGTSVWYRFDMFIDGTIPANAGRLVIGQWKQNNAPGDASPILAQRFGTRTFTVTIQQDNDEPNRFPSDAECRIFVATQGGTDQLLGGSPSRSPPAQHLSDRNDPDGAASEHADADTSKRLNARRVDALACGSDISVTTYNPLPDPFNKWTTMVYHLRIGADGNGLIEVWANGTKISRTTGRIGYRAPAGGQQYFKFGPYRDNAGYTTLTRLSRYIRSVNRSFIDPDGTLTPD